MKQFLWLLVLVTWQTCAATTDRPPFFYVEGQEGHAWLLGSVHVGKADFYPFPKMIEDAYLQADALALEADTESPQVASLMQAYLLADEPLPQQVEAELNQYCQQKGLQCHTQLAPWILSSQLAMAIMAESGYDAQSGVESYFRSKAEVKPIRELEGMKFQLEMFDSLPRQTQLEMLQAAMEPIDVEELINSWRSGDHQGLAKLTEEEMASDPHAWQVLMLDRNQSMSATLKGWLAEPANLFVIIGAGHLVGQHSIPKALTAMGVKVTDCWQQRCPTPTP